MIRSMNNKHALTNKSGRRIIYTVWHEESDVQVKLERSLRLDGQHSGIRIQNCYVLPRVYVVCCFKLFIGSFIENSEALNNRTGCPNNSYGRSPGGPGTGLCSPGGGFLNLSSRSGLPLRLLPLKPNPGTTKTSTRTTRTSPVLVISSPVAIIYRYRV